MKTVRKRRKIKSRQIAAKEYAAKKVDLFAFTVRDLRKEIMRTEKTHPNALIYADIGGPKLKAFSTAFYPSGINGKPSFLIITESPPDKPELEVKLANKIVEVIKIMMGKDEH